MKIRNLKTKQGLFAVPLGFFAIILSSIYTEIAVQIWFWMIGMFLLLVGISELYARKNRILRLLRLNWKISVTILVIALYIFVEVQLLGSIYKHLSISDAISISRKFLITVDRFQNGTNSYGHIDRREFEGELQSIVAPDRMDNILSRWDRLLANEFEGMSLQTYKSFQHGDDPKSVIKMWGAQLPDGYKPRLKIVYGLYGVESVSGEHLDKYVDVSVYLDAILIQSIIKDFYRWRVVGLEIENIVDN